jgi:hypothetical protein
MSEERVVGSGVGGVLGFFAGAFVLPAAVDHPFAVAVVAGPISAAIVGWSFGPELRNPVRPLWQTGLLFGYIAWPAYLLTVAVATSIEIAMSGGDWLGLLPRLVVAVVAGVAVSFAVPLALIGAGPLGVAWAFIGKHLLPHQPEEVLPQLGASSRR